MIKKINRKIPVVGLRWNELLFFGEKFLIMIKIRSGGKSEKEI